MANSGLVELAPPLMSAYASSSAGIEGERDIAVYLPRKNYTKRGREGQEVGRSI